VACHRFGNLTVVAMEDVVFKRFAACLTLLPFAAIAAPESYTVDSVHSFPNFSIDRAVSTIYGRFDKTTGKVTLDRAAKSGSIDLAIEAASISTGDNDKGARARSRDEHLRAADFFNAAEFPRLTYKSTKVVFTGDEPSAVEGNLTLLGVTKPVNLTIEKFKCLPASGNNKERCGGNAVDKFKRSDFGMKYGVPNIGDEVTLMIGLEVLKD
jgi:polyisoprenoid-binding protein YceI